MSVPQQQQALSATTKDEDDASTAAAEMIPRAGSIRFGTFDVTSQVFYKTAHTFALVNLKPLLPGHILVCPLHNNHQQRPPQSSSFSSTPTEPPPSRLKHLTPTQTTDLFSTVQRLTPTLTRLYSASAFNIAIQDGEAAGQSVPHVHVHVIPRKAGDMDSRGGGDAIYEMMEGREGNIAQHQRQQQLEEQDTRQGSAGSQAEETEGKLPGLDAPERRPRAESEMRDEADMLKRELASDGVFSAD